MLIEISCVLGLVAFAILLVKGKSLIYILGFLYGLAASFLVEPAGVAHKAWYYQNIIYPFNYPVLGVPICIHLLYGTVAAFAVWLVRGFIIERRKYKNELDRYFAYGSIITSLLFFYLYYFFGFNRLIAMAFLMIGIFLLVKSPIMFYVGFIAMISDFVFEYLYIKTGQFGYAISQGSVAVNWFFGTAILTGLVLLIGRRLDFKKLKKLFAKKRK